MSDNYTHIELGNTHFYYLSQVMAIRVKEYEAMSLDERNDICTNTTAFGEVINPKLFVDITKSPSHKFFYGRRRFWADQSSKYRKGTEDLRLTEEVRELFDPIKNFCDLYPTYETGAHVIIPKYKLEDPDVAHFMTFITLTR